MANDVDSRVTRVVSKLRYLVRVNEVTISHSTHSNEHSAVFRQLC